MPCHLFTALSCTHAAIVPVLPMSKVGLSGAETKSFVPSNERPPPILPVVHAGPFWSVTLLLFPDESAATVPLPSSSFQYAAGPPDGGGGGGLPAAVVKVKLPEVARLPAPALDLTR